MKIGDKVKKLRKSLRLTQREFGKKANIPLRTLASLEINEHLPGPKLLNKIAQSFSVDLNWLIADEEESIIARSPTAKYATEKLVSLPILGNVPAGYPITPIERVDGYFSLPQNQIKDPKAFILKVQGASMEPDIYENDLIVVSPLRKTEIKGTGDLAVVHCDSGEVAIKYVHKEKRGIILSSRNPKYPPQLIAGDQTLEIIGKVILKIHFY